MDAEAFFRDYTPYIVSTIYILKNGITTRGLNIPSMSHLTLAEGVDEVTTILDLDNNTIQSLMNEIMPFVHEQRYDTSIKMLNREDALDVFESTDLRPIVGYLKDYDQQMITRVSMKGCDCRMSKAKINL